MTLSKTDKLLERYAWFNLEENDLRSLVNPLDLSNIQDVENPDLYFARLMRNPNNFYFTCKHLLNIEIMPMQMSVLKELWVRPFPMLIGARGLSKTFMLALYALLRCILIPKTRIVLVGGAFRQSKLIFEAMEGIWAEAPIMRDICSGNSGTSKDNDRWTFRINDSTTVAIPLGTGEKIRGLRANVIICDEFRSINPQIYEIVVQGFATVSQNVVMSIKNAARRKFLKGKGEWTEKDQSRYDGKRVNQSIISGTAGFHFEHFYNYWNKYKKIVKSKGDLGKLLEVFPDGVDPNFNWRDYSVIRIPSELVPEGLMDEKHIIRAKATVHSGIFGMEYGAVFSADSTGFFKRTLIESCVAKKSKPVELTSGEVWFDASTRGRPKHEYIYAVDPASEQDNFAVMILEIHPDHRRIVYCWTTNRKQFGKMKVEGMTTEDDFFGFCARKIRELDKTFPASVIGIDSQGGGIALLEAFHDGKKIKENEQLFWPEINEDKPEYSDEQAGRHILSMINFADYQWLTSANHGLKKDMESKALLFPQFDNITLGLAAEDDRRESDSNQKNRLHDSLENVVLEIEDLKDELCSIVRTTTGTGRERWDIPSVKLENGKRVTSFKDRYSALLIANKIARDLLIASTQNVGRRYPIGMVRSFIGKKAKGKLYDCPPWYEKVNTDNLCRGVVRR